MEKMLKVKVPMTPNYIHVGDMAMDISEIHGEGTKRDRQGMDGTARFQGEEPKIKQL